MVTNKHFPKLIVVVMAVAVVLCFLAMAFADELSVLLGGTGVKMEYESKLFNTDEIISVDIEMDEDEWNKMLSSAMTEEYYVCDVVINGKSVKNVAIRPKGNTSLSAIAMDADNNRYSLKLEFDHFVDGQTCYGLDKLILNNNYADATNMKEALIYDMFQFIGADASLYNYAKVTVNGEYWGVYLALEAVEESFQLRNFGTQDGELYKPDSMEMGGGNSDSSSSSKSSVPDMGNADASRFAGKTPPSRPGSSDAGEVTTKADDTGTTVAADAETGASQSSSRPSSGASGFDLSNMPDMGSFDPNNMPEMGDFDPNNVPEGFDPNNIPGGGSDTTTEPATETTAPAETTASDDSTKTSESRSGSSRGGFSRGGGANLNYTDDELDSYSTIWDGAITGTSKADQRRVVTALKNISEGTDLETYLDVDNVLKYMAVHVFSVNMDSLSGSMAHNYYLYEYDGQLNLFPWDYNLSLGGMSMGSGGDGTSVVNDAIDTPFSGTQFFNALLENEEYLARYHAYLQQLVDEYVNGGRFEETYNRIRSQIDALVETDPNAMYTYEQYLNAVEILYEVVNLRAQSIDGQLKGTIPSTDAGQREDDSALIDASHIDVSVMGKFNMGGFQNGSPNRRSGRSNSQTTTETTDETATEPSAAATTEATTEPTTEPTTEATTAAPETTQPSPPGGASGFPGGFSPGDPPKGFDPGNMPDMGSFDPGNMPDMGDFDPGNMPDMGGMTPPDAAPETTTETTTAEPTTEDATEATTEAPQTSEPAPDDATKESGSSRPSFSGMPDQSSNETLRSNLILFGVCFVIMIAALIGVMLYKRRK